MYHHLRLKYLEKLPHGALAHFHHLLHKQLIVDSLFPESRRTPTCRAVNCRTRSLETPSTPSGTTLVSGVSFSHSGSSLHTSSSKKPQSLAMRCTLALLQGWPQHHDGLQQLSPNLHGSIFRFLWYLVPHATLLSCQSRTATSIPK